MKKPLLSALVLLSLSQALLSQAQAANTLPARLDPYIICPLQSQQSPQATVAGQSRDYLSATAAAYHTPGWESRVAASWEALDEARLGTLGHNLDNETTTMSVPENVRIVAIDIRRMEDEWLYHYFSNGTALHPIDTGTSSQVQAIFLAGLKLRQISAGQVGLSSSVDGEPLSQLITDLARYTHKDSGGWFKTVMGPQAMSDFLNRWLLRTDKDPLTGQPTAGEHFAGNYGVSPRDIGGTPTRFYSPDGQLAEVQRDTKFRADDRLSPLSMAESWKRIFVHMTDPATRPTLAGATLIEEDLRTLLYGHADPRQQEAGGLLLGGSEPELVEAIGGKRRLDQKTGGQWRLFGLGDSSFSERRQRYEASYLGAACFPAAKGGLTQTRALVFFVSVQAAAAARRDELHYLIIERLFRQLVPELFVEQF